MKTLCALFPLLLTPVLLASDFMQEFRKAMKAGDDAAMKALVESRQDDAIQAVIATCEAIAEGTSEKLETEIAALGSAWKAAYDTKFVQGQYEYFALLPADYRRSRAELKEQYDAAVARYEKAIAEESYLELPGIGQDLGGYADAFEELGDLYHASEAWLMNAWSFEEKYLEERAELKLAYDGFQKGLALRERIDLDDGAAKEARARLAVLEEAGVGEAGEEFAGGLASRATEAGARMLLAPSFELVEDIEDVMRPRFTNDSLYQIWPTIYLGKDGSTAKINSLGGEVTAIREGAAEVTIDVDADGKGDVPIPMTGNVEPVQITLGQGGDRRPWAFLTRIGRENEDYQDFKMNLESDTNQLQVFIAPASSLVCTIGETPLRVFDDNMDGKYGGPVVYWPEAGVVDGSFQADMDTVLVGSEKAARPWSEYQEIEDVWYRFETGPEGEAEPTTGTTGELAVTPVDVPTGTLELDFNGPKPDYVIVKGSGKYENCYFDLVPGGKKGTEVPVGTYTLVSGRLSKGKRAQMAKALIVPGESGPKWKVAKDEETTAELGAPFGFAFEVRQDDETVTVVGASVVVTGVGGEQYQRFWNCVPTPEASVRTVGSKKGSKGEDMRTAQHQDDLIEGYHKAWFPWDIQLDKKKSGEEAEVQLVEKKNKLFGKIESEWRK